MKNVKCNQKVVGRYSL